MDRVVSMAVQYCCEAVYVDGKAHMVLAYAVVQQQVSGQPLDHAEVRECFVQASVHEGNPG